MAESRRTLFDIVTYCSPLLVEQVRQLHWEQIEWFCWIQHDRDFADPFHPDNGETKPVHCHVVMKTNLQLSRKNVKGWFYDRFYHQNTFVEFCDHPVGACRYLLHLDDQMKVQYPRSSVVCYGLDYDSYIQSEDAPVDPYRSMILDALDGVSDEELLRRYGNLYVRNEFHIDRIVKRISAQRADQYIQNENNKEIVLNELCDCCECPGTEEGQ